MNGMGDGIPGTKEFSWINGVKTTTTAMKSFNWSKSKFAMPIL